MTDVPQLFELDVAGMAEVTEAGIEIHRCARGRYASRLLNEGNPRLYELVGWNEKFAAHNAAVWEHGLFVHVPKGVVLEKPLYVRITNTVDGGSLFWRLLVIAEEGSKFTLIEEYASATRSSPATRTPLSSSSSSRPRSSSTSRCRTCPRRPGTSRTTTRASSATPSSTGSPAGLARRRARSGSRTTSSGPGATSRVTGAYFADGDQHLDYDTFQEHIAPSTESDFAFKGALRESARSVWRGMIRVEPDAQKTNAYQENRNLLLSDDAHADSIPGLEIMANDVRCTHGATLGKVNREELFYLMSRGLSRGEAERLIVRGFFQDVLDRIELEPVREALGAALEARIPQG